VSDVLAVCNSGHQFVLKDFEPLEDVIAAISWCPEMVAKEGSLLVTECSDIVLWIKNLPKRSKVKRTFVLPHQLKYEQLDLFEDTKPNDDTPLTSSEESVNFSGEGHS